MAVNINVPSQVRTFANLAAFPATGAVKTIYIAEDTNKTYRWDGSTYVEISASAATSLTIGTTPIASGTIGRVLFQGTGNVLQQSSSLFWDGTNNRLGIGTSSPNSALEVVEPNSGGFIAAARFLVPNNNVAGRVSQFYLGTAMTTLNSIAWSFHYQGNGSTANYQSFGFNGIATPALTMFGTLNVGINTTTDAGFKLDVNGTARFTGQTTYATTMNFGGNTDQISPSSNSGNFDILSNLPIRFLQRTGSVERMRIVSSTGNVLINTTTDAGFRLDVNGTARVVGQLSSGASGSNGSIALRRTSDGNIVGSFYTEGGGVVVKEHTGTGGVLLNGFDTTSLKWMGNASQPRVGIGFNGTINATCHIKGAFATSATSSLLIENSAGTAAMRVRDDLVILLPSLPTSPTGLPTGAIWNNLGILTIV